MSLSSPPKALLTDVFGTVVDWRGTVTNYLITTADETLNSSSSSIPSSVRAAVSSLDWGEFAWQWRKSYYNFTRTYDPASMPFKSVDQHHCEALIDLMQKHSIQGLWQEDEIKKISMIWHFLDPWPDSSRGLGLLNEKFETCTLSNGNTSLLQDLADHGKLPYKHIFSGEDFKAYKPNPKVYNGAAAKLGLKPSECGLVAAHLNDLKAARGCGYQTIYIERSQEEQFSEEEIEEAKSWVDMWISINEPGFEEAAKRFGCSGNNTQSRKSNADIEADADQGVYHETGSITGMQGHDTTSHVTQPSVEQKARDGTFHEDPSITR